MGEPSLPLVQRRVDDCLIDVDCGGVAQLAVATAGPFELIGGVLHPVTRLPDRRGPPTGNTPNPPSGVGKIIDGHESLTVTGLPLASQITPATHSIGAYACLTEIFHGSK